MIAAVLLIEAIGLGGPQLPLVLLPGLLAAGDRLARLDRHGLVHRPEHAAPTRSARCRCRTSPRPTLADFVWTVPLAAAIARVAS